MVDTSKIPNFKGNYKSIKKNGNTSDIIASIGRQEQYYSDSFCQFAKQFEGGNGGSTAGLKKLWHFVKYDIQYDKDSFEKSKQLTPPALWHIKKGDCKSKTIFINCVLRCIGIPYLTRYTNYEKGEKNVKHVYTVAIINGKELPIDSVYDWFGIEKPYQYKIDYPMTEIIEISGIEKKYQRKEVVRSNSYVKTVCDAIRSPGIATSPNLKRLEEIRQKKQYVKQPDPIEFNKINEGIASLEIAIRELEIIKVMRPEVANLAEKGIEIFRGAEKGNFCPTGDIPNELGNVVLRVKAAEKLQHLKSNGFGLPGLKRRNLINRCSLERKSGADIGNLDSYPQRGCLIEGQFMMEIPTEDYSVYPPIVNWETGNYTTPEGYVRDYGFCQNLDNYRHVKVLGGVPDSKTFGEIMFYLYGSESKYRSSINYMWNPMLAKFKKLREDYVLNGYDVGAYGEGSFWFNTKADFELTIDEMNESSGVLDKYLNDIFAADSSRIDGTVGSGLFYSFADGMTFNNAPININDLPGSVINKRGFQDQFLDATNMFSGISRSNVKGLARNGVLFDNGGIQPEDSLNSLQAIYENRYNTPGINCPPCPVIIAIVALVGAIVAAVAKASEATVAAEREAARIDTAAADTSRLSAIGQSLMPGQDDFTPGKFAKIVKDNKGTLLLGAAAVGGAYMVLNKDKK